MALTRYGSCEVIEVYKTAKDIERLKKSRIIASRGGSFCTTDACPFPHNGEFTYDPTNFLFYRARAITADVVNLNGDLFEHAELLPSYSSFCGKGVYFNHDSLTPDKAFGVILDASYTPVLFNDNCYPDKYTELLCAIDRKVIAHKRPGLLEDIESGRITSTSMGTLAKQAKCSVCGNIATDFSNLCVHMHPQSPLYCKGRLVNGTKAYETNYGLTFIEDSIVYVPADPTAHMLEIYASRRSDGDMKRLADLFAKYSVSAGRKITESPIELTSNFTNTGGLIMAAAENKDDKPVTSPYQEAIGEITEQVSDDAKKMINTKVDRISVEELRKVFGPLLEQIDKLVRPEIKTRVEQEYGRAKSEMGKVLPDVAKAQPGPVGVSKTERVPASPAPETAPAPKQSTRTIPIDYTEDFSSWGDAERQKLVQAVIDRKSWNFKGVLEMPEGEGK